MMNGYLTTHVLDTARGIPAHGLNIELFRLEETKRLQLKSMQTNSDGRTDQPILPTEEFVVGEYELLFHAGDYLRATGQAGNGLLFLDIVPIRFGMAQDDHYHVPLLLSPFGMSTYRGS